MLPLGRVPQCGFEFPDPMLSPARGQVTDFLCSDLLRLREGWHPAGSSSSSKFVSSVPALGGPGRSSVGTLR